ncbi:biofilm peroxide resistance protein BsmA [Chimaeribacter arupi]|uniref:biofilm peroxide resistance protein BsmA n=1 Tax=Yersiniaceae TaxID=1903411 RepID=UPI0009331F48|nr:MULTISPECIES: biofilm peroxide resistance protein BsmA [Yersiniaceae]MDV5142233.1 biofilm peroxide resistance protein BsmA [Chimaeribacter arupi]PLR34929.1 biofilm peroxide resistance protein BsmA [Chimaeribacter arupi]PLR45799.1 biofilm peroxide resistance protein BsmA [Chimaeribacter arupi]PLR52969.1 biofilm peroxide resistance protein BsmA [Chimaeribacter arupi]
MTFSRLLTGILLAGTLSGCSTFHDTPKPPPPATAAAQEVTRAQVDSLQKMGTISVTERGSPMDAARALQKKADASGARYYLVLMNDETIIPGTWYSQAILYR